MSAADSESERPPNVQWNDVVRFVRQLSHDLRNHLNAAELQSAFLGELATDAEMKDEITRLRQMISVIGSSLQKVTANLGMVRPTLMPYRADTFIQDLRTKIAAQFPAIASQVEWDIPKTDHEVQIDPQLLQEAILELFGNAAQHGRSSGNMRFGAGIDSDTFLMTLDEPKTTFDLPTENWGREPLHRVNRGHYGLGLNRVRAIVEGHGGQLRAQYDSSASKLRTTISLPLSGSTNQAT